MAVSLCVRAVVLQMPSASETKMNLSALQQVDPEINEIVDSATQVALFQYSTQTSQWTKTDIEGALFVYAHRNPSERGLIILNRHSPKNYKEPITADIEFKMNQPFLIYKTPSGQIFGAWFYVADECTRVGNRCCRLVSYLKKREKSAGGGGGQGSSDKTNSILQGLLLPPNPGGNVGSNNNEKNGGGNNSYNNLNNNGNSNNHNSSNGKQNGQQAPQGKDIMSLLQRAQIEDKPPAKKPLGQNNNANRKQEGLNGTGGQRRMNGGQGGGHYESSPGVPVVHKPVPTKALPPSVEQLFKSAGRKTQQQQNSQQQQQQNSQQQNQVSSSNGNSGATTSGVQLIQSLAQQIPQTPQRAEHALDRLLSLAGSSPTSSHIGVVAPTAPPMNDCMASILNKLNESAQKVQREQQQLQQHAAGGLDAGRISPQESAPPVSRSNLANALFGALAGGAVSAGTAGTPPAGGTIGGEKKLTLITPEMLEESLSQTGPMTPPQSQPTATAAALSRTELRGALVHLLENDDDFLTKIHHAYLQGASRRKLLTTFPYDHV